MSRRRDVPWRGHPRVVHVSDLAKHPTGVYVGRGDCRCGAPPICGHGLHGEWGNPFTVEEHGHDALLKFIDWLGDQFNAAQLRNLTKRLAGKVLGCWCRGRYIACHAEVLARLADGDTLDVIRADLVLRLGLGQGSLF